MFRHNRPRYWVDWYDRWHLLLVVLLVLLLCWLGYLATLPAPHVSLALADPAASLVSTKPIELIGTAPANALVRVYDGDRLVGETRAASDGTFKLALTNVAPGAHTLRGVVEVDSTRIESSALQVNVSAPAVALAPTATPVPPTATTVPPTATRVPPTATAVPPTATAVPTLAPGALQRRGKDNAEMVYIPAGEFTLGEAASARTIYLDAFWMDKFEVTNAQFQQFVDATGYKTDAEKQGWGFEYTNVWQRMEGISWRAPRGAGSTIQLAFPVVLVSWNDANAYCAWAGKRLPTEAEWEKAARGSDARVFPWGNQWDGTRLNFCDSNCAYAWKDASVNDRYAEVAPVGSYAANASPYGVLDLAGNVWEWTADWFDADYPRTMPTRNPIGPTSGQLKVLRGGAWSIDAFYARATSRFAQPPDFRERSVGFRCVQ
jgi:formylglycine-generating enzyme required for sulfatase activity